MGRARTRYLMLLAIGFMTSSISACAEEETPQASVDRAGSDRAGSDRAGSDRASSDKAAMHIDEQVSQAKRKLAVRLNVDVSEISEETVRVVAWQSGAKGCPDPDMSYTMAIQPGTLIMLRVGGEIHRYHSGQDGKPFYCPADRAEAPALGQGEEVM